MDALNKLQDIFRDFFDDEDLVITRETSPSDIEDWDSFAQINIITICEAEFGVKLGLNDIVKLKNAGDIADAVERKLTS